MSANGKSLISKEERGFIKILSDSKSHAVVGVQMMCARATDMIGEFGNAVANGLYSRAAAEGYESSPQPTMKEWERLWRMCSEKRYIPCRRKNRAPQR